MPCFDTARYITSKTQVNFNFNSVCNKGKLLTLYRFICDDLLMTDIVSINSRKSSLPVEVILITEQ